ncbi:MAG: hypothetical protein KKH88_04155 [Nanoarchaeota archaeon]|nr:hypothetical protein [Nanoarchaeota archaeon]
MKRRKLTEIVAGLLATALTLGSVSPVFAQEQKEVRPIIYYELTECNDYTIAAVEGLSEQRFSPYHTIKEIDGLTFAVANYCAAIECGCDEFDEPDWDVLNLYGGLEHEYSTFAGELIYRLLEDFELDPKLRAKQIDSILDVAEHIEPDIVKKGYERLDDYYSSGMGAPTFETIPALYRPAEESPVEEVVSWGTIKAISRGSYSDQHHETIDYFTEQGKCSSAVDYIRANHVLFEGGEFDYILGRTWLCLADEAKEAERRDFLLKAHNSFRNAEYRGWGFYDKTKGKVLDETLNSITEELIELGVLPEEKIPIREIVR